MAVVLAFVLLVVLAAEKRVYMVQEITIVMLLVAISVVAILLLSIAFVLFQEGIRQAIHSMKIGILRLAKFSRRHLGPPDSVIPGSLHR